MKRVLIVLCGLLAASCSREEQTDARVHAEDGLSEATAVILKPGSVQESAASKEEAWLSQHYPGFRRCPGRVVSAQSGNEGEAIIHFAHRTEVAGDRLLSVLCVILPDGAEQEFFFDITEYSSEASKKPANQRVDPTSVPAPRNPEGSSEG